MTKHFDFRVGNEVWVMHDDCAVCAIVTKIYYHATFRDKIGDKSSIIECESYHLSIGDKPLYESFTRDQLFPTKKELIESL